MEHSVAIRDLGRGRPARLPSELRGLRWTAVVIPVAFVVLLELVRENAAPVFWHSAPGFALTLLLVSAAAVAFARSVFIQIARHEARAAKRSAQIEALNRLAAAASENLELKTIIGRGLDQIVAATGADASLVCRLHADAEEHSAIGAHGFSQAMLDRIQHAKLAEDRIASEVVATRQPVRFGDVFKDPTVRQASGREGIQSGISVPLMSGGEVNGIVVVAYRREHEFDEDDYVFLNGVGKQLGMAIHNAQIYEESLAQNRQLSALLQVQAAVASSLELGEVLDRSLEAVTKLTSADAGEVWLPQDERFVLHRADGAPGLLGVTRSCSSGLLARAAEAGAALRLKADAPDFPPTLGAAGYAVCCAVPLRFRGALQGVLLLASRGPDAMSRPSEVRLLDAIGDQIAPAVVNATLHREIQRVSVLQERERISREMHDGLGQVLGYVNTQALAVQRLLGRGDVDAAGEELRRLDAAARSVYSDVRDHILALRSASGEQALTEALARYTDSFRETFGLDVTLTVTPEAQAARLSAASELQLIRMVQQTLTNVRQHAHATSVRVALRVLGDTLEVTVRDDGEGFDPEALPAVGRPRFGLQMMRERASAAGGTFSIDSRPGEGACVTVRVPVR